MVAVPAVGTVSPSSARMLVVFPEPVGPRNAVIRPGRTSTERSSTAVRVRYRFVREVKEMATGAPFGSVGGGERAWRARLGRGGGARAPSPGGRPTATAPPAHSPGASRPPAGRSAPLRGDRRTA